MKTFTVKEFISLAVIVLSATVLALAVFSAGRVAGENSLLLLALTLCGAVVSGINGFGRRTVRTKSHSRQGRGGPQSNVALKS